MNFVFSKKQNDVDIGTFDFVRFLSDLFGLEPVSAYPIGAWLGHCQAIIKDLEPSEYQKLAEIYDTRQKDTNGYKRFINKIHTACRNSRGFFDLDQIILDYEEENFCSFAGDFCKKCNRPGNFAVESNPLCYGRRLLEHFSASEIAKPMKQDGESSDESEEFAKQIAAHLGQEHKPGFVGEFYYDFLLAGVPTFIWRFQGFEMDRAFLSDILEKARESGIEQIYIAAFAHLIHKLPGSIDGCISYVMLPLVTDDQSVPVFDYVSSVSSVSADSLDSLDSSDEGVGKPN